MSAVSQRTAAAGVQTAAEASEGTGQEESTSQRTPRSRYPYLKVPTWYEHAHFQYTRRFVLALVPGLFLLGVAEGANIFAALSICALVIFLVHQGGGSWISVILTLTSMLTLSVVSMYSVAPLIWRSILNYPIALVAHYILLCCGGLALIQLRAFQDYDPSMTVMMEKALFSAFPMALVLPVVWEHLMLFQVTYLPYTVTLTWFVGLSLFVVPLKSSFAKHNTPLHEALVLHKLAAQAYMGLFLVVPLLLNLTFIRHSNPLNALLSTVLFIFLPAFLLTLLESQGIFYWIGVSPTLPPFLRQVFGAVVLVAGSMLLYRSGESGLLLLALPLAAVQLLAVSASGEGAEGVSMRKVLATACVGITYIGGFIALPWHIVHSLESVVSLPLQAVQVALLALALSSVAMFVFWRQLSSAGVWLVYTAAFVSCEHLLLQERVYPPLLLLLTAALGTAVLQRLWSVRHISRNAAWLCISLHVTKLTQLLLPAASSLASVALAHCAVFLVAAAVSRLVLYQTRKNLKPSHLVFFTFLFCVGLLLSVDPLLSPLWVTITHSLIPLSLIVAMSLFACAVYVYTGMWSLGKSPPQWLSQLPLAIIGLAVLLGTLQPEMGWEMFEAMAVVYAHYVLGPNVLIFGMHPHSPGTLVAAWTTLLEWAVMITVVAAVISVRFTQKSYHWVPTLQWSVMGATVGLLMAAWLLHIPPTSGQAIEYAAVCALTAALVARAITATEAGSYVDSIMFFLQIVLFATNFFTEVFHIDTIQEYEPDAPFISRYVPPTSRLHVVVFLVLAVTFKSKQFHLQSVDQSPSLAYMPLAGNIACCLVYTLTLINPVHMQFVTSVLLSSLVFLLIQQDSIVLKVSTSNFPLAPCVLVAVVTLYIANMGRLLRMISDTVHLSLLAASLYYGELALLLLGIPGHFLVVWYLWTGRGSVFNMKLWMVLTLFLPNSALAYLSSSPHSLTLAGVAVSGLALTAAQSQK